MHYGLMLQQLQLTIQFCLVTNHNKEDANQLLYAVTCNSII